MRSDRAKFDGDFHFVRDHLSDFFDRGSVQRALDLIDDVEITGWEKWWQVEFASWLAEQDGVGDWVMEEVFLTDLRRNSGKDSIAIDIGFRLKGYSSSEMLFLELKQNSDWRKCVENMLRDFEKVECAQTHSVENKLRIRSFFVAGIPPAILRRRKCTTTFRSVLRNWIFQSSADISSRSSFRGLRSVSPCSEPSPTMPMHTTCETHAPDGGRWAVGGVG